MRRLWWAVAVAFLVAVGASGAGAQRTTGDIRGVVTDDSGAALPGVTVTVRGPAVAGSPTTVTNESGVYRFPSLAPGTYEVSAELAGFSTYLQRGIAVSLGATATVDVVMRISQLSETITVTAAAPVVDSTSTQVATNYNREWVENAPVRRFTFFDLVNAAPGVSPSTSTSSRSQSFGSATNENLYLLDGTDFTAPFTGAAWPWPNTDAIEEVQVLSLGAPADYGNLGGAVFNIVTRQGSNQFHGDGNFYYQNQSLTARNTTEEQDLGLPYNRAKFQDTTWQLGGPVVKDKFWFFGSFQYQHDSDSQPGTDPEFPAVSTGKRFFGKLNYQINQNNRLQGQYHDDFYEIPERASALRAPSTMTVETGHNPSPGVLWSSVINSSTVAEVRYSGFYGTDHGDPLNGGPRVARRYIDLDTGAVTGGIYNWYDGKSQKSAVSGKVTKFADNFLGGSHDFKLGVQFNTGFGEYTYGPNDYIYTYGSTPAYGYTQLPYTQGGRMKSIGAYADDTWQVGRATLNIGLRFDNSTAYFVAQDLLDAQGKPTGQQSKAIDNLFNWRVLSPRLGMTYKLTQNASSVVKVNYGRYYRGIVTGEFDNTSPSLTPRFVFSGLYSATGVPLDKELVSDNSQLSVDPNLTNPYIDQFIANFEQQIGANIGFSVSLVHKRGENNTAFPDITGVYTTVPWTTAPAGASVPSVFQLQSSASARRFQLRNDDRMFTRYTGVAFELRKRLANRWQANLGYTLSKSTGRIGSVSARSSPLTNQTSTAGIFGQNPNDFLNTDGRLNGDRPHVFKGQVTAQLPWGIMASTNVQVQSGKPIITEVRAASSLTRIPGTTRIVANPVDGSLRTLLWTQVDARLEKSLSLGKGAELALFGDLLNALNTDASESVLDRRPGTPNYLLPSRFVFPRRLMLGGKFRF